MNAEKITVYISDNCKYCRQVIALLDEWDIRYSVKNVSQHRQYMKELQVQGIYGTPATYIHRTNQYILGIQVEELKKAVYK